MTGVTERAGMALDEVALALLGSIRLRHETVHYQNAKVQTKKLGIRGVYVNS